MFYVLVFVLVLDVLLLYIFVREGDCMVMDVLMFFVIVFVELKFFLCVVIVVKERVELIVFFKFWFGCVSYVGEVVS